LDTEESWPPPVAWSLAVEKDEAQSQGYRWIAVMYFRVEDAPHESLRQGREFELYEGNKCVARGKILVDTVPASEVLKAASSA